MAVLARDRETQYLKGPYVFTFGGLVQLDGLLLGWVSTSIGEHNLLYQPGNNWQGPHLEPGEGPFEVELKMKSTRCHDVSDLYEDEPDGE